MGSGNRYILLLRLCTEARPYSSCVELLVRPESAELPTHLSESALQIYSVLSSNPDITNAIGCIIHALYRHPRGISNTFDDPS